MLILKISFPKKICTLQYIFCGWCSFYIFSFDKTSVIGFAKLKLKSCTSSCTLLHTLILVLCNFFLHKNWEGCVRAKNWLFCSSLIQKGEQCNSGSQHFLLHFLYSKNRLVGKLTMVPEFLFLCWQHCWKIVQVYIHNVRFYSTVLY